jgi:DNA-binding transcriptional LysR family regulator
MKKFPKLMLQFKVDDREHRHQQLKKGECQFAILQPMHVEKEMEHKILKPENYLLVCAYEWRKRKLIDILKKEYIIDFDLSDQLTFLYLKNFKLLSYAQQARHFVNRPETLAMLIINQRGYGLLNAEFAKPYIDAKQLFVLNDGKIYQQPYALCWYNHPELPAYFKAIIDAIE